MTPLEPASISHEEVARQISDIIDSYFAGEPVVRQAYANLEGKTRGEIEGYIATDMAEKYVDKEIYMNETYQVNVRRLKSEERGVPDIVHLSIRRLDRQPVIDWRDKQAIKNQILGPEVEAVELYPAESRLIDTANQFHLWAYDTEQFQFPFGFTAGRFTSETSLGKSVNRPFEK